MQVRLGWTGETQPNQWSKADITVDEGDLDRLMAEAELPAGLGAKLPTKVVFQLLQNEAEILLLSRLTDQGYPPDKATSRTARMLAGNQQIFDAVRKQLAAS